MADYKKMYAVLCSAVDSAIDSLAKNPLARSETKKLQEALLEAEEIYIETVPYTESDSDDGIIRLKTDS